LALALLFITPALGAERQSLSGHVPVAAMRLKPVGRLPTTKRLDLAIGLPLRNQAELNGLLEQLYDPASPQYRHYLTLDQFTERFGATKEDYDAVTAFAKLHGLTVTGTHPNRTLLDISGSVADIETALHVKLQLYQHPTEARTFHAPDVEPTVDLAVPVLHFSGLDNFNRIRPLGRRAPRGPGRRPKSLTGSGPGGAFMGNDFRAAYLPGVTLTGAGQSVALLEFDGYYPSDITDYESLAGLTNVPLQNVLVDGFDGSAGVNNAETALDIEMAISMAPGLSKVIIYEAPLDGSSITSPAVNDLLNRIATDDAAKQISSSWALTPDATGDQILKQYSVQGQSFFLISGDWGAYPSLWVGDDPHATIVGGTELNTTGPGGAWVSETVWNLGFYPSRGIDISSGGGISPTYAIPSWQKGVSMGANKGSITRRNSPDVSLVADNVWQVSNNGDSFVGWGTSASSPLWAGLAALANELAAAHGQPPIGFINPAIYALGKGAGYNPAFHDITVGNNTTLDSPANFFAVPGYDLCTGWGTPNGTNLLYALALPERLQITPGTNSMPGGEAGGPFVPSTQTYSLTNIGNSALGWAVAASVAWLDLSTTSGTLAPGDPAATVTVSLNSDANHLPPGTYTAALWFTNLSSGSVQSQAFTLGVFFAPVIESGPVSEIVPEGATATFTVVAAAIGTVSYQWRRDGIILTDDARIHGSTNSNLTISNASATDAGSYAVLVVNSIGVSVSSVATLAVVPSPPVIVAESTNQTVASGVTVTFAVQAVGTPPLFYQWRDNGADITSGGTANILILHNVSPADAGTYSLVVSNTLGSVTNAGSVLAVIPVTAPGVTLATVYSFRNGSDGANPNGLVVATNGYLYGTANWGGVNGSGTLFRVSTNGALTTLHAFTGGNDGYSPKAGLTKGADGNLYGTAWAGGANNSGTIFRMSLNGALTTLHAFNGANDGDSPLAGLVQAADGNFYGTASSGGSSGGGTVFKVTPNGALTTLHSFVGADGSDPVTGLVQAKDGNLYGTTKRGGANDYDGTVFKISTSGALTTLFDFKGTNSFSPRGGLVQGSDGNLYGTTFNGGAHGRGTVFRIAPEGVLTTIHSFNGSGDGQWPAAAVFEGQDGYFYGTTSYGGTYGDGTVFRMSPNGQLTSLLYFDGFIGANPAAPLVMATDGSFYGTTINGGANGDGTVFRLTVPALSLNIASAGSQIVLSWPSWASDLLLQQNSDLTTTNWTAVTAQPVMTNLQYQVLLSPAPSGNTFYRLTH